MSFPFSSEEKPKSLHWPTGIIWSHLVTLLCHLLSSSGFHLPPVSGTYQPYFYFHWLILLPKTLFHRGILPNSLIFLIFCWLNLSPTPSPCLLCLIFTILLSTAVHTSILHIFHLFLPFFSVLHTYLEKEMATPSSSSTWKIPRMEEPCMLQSLVSQRVRHNWATSLSLSYLLLFTPLLIVIAYCYSVWECKLDETWDFHVFSSLM